MERRRLQLFASRCWRLVARRRGDRRNGRVTYLRAVGFRDWARTTPLQLDKIFWFASMTTPVINAAATMLVEQGE